MGQKTENDRDDMSMRFAAIFKGRIGTVVTVIIVAGGVVLLALWQANVFVPDRIAPGVAAVAEEQVKVLQETTVRRVSVPRYYEVVGTIRSRDEVDVSPRLTARIAAITKRSGDRATSGEILAQLDDADLQAALAGAKHALAAAKSSLATARSREVAARAACEVAEKQVLRTRELAASQTVSKAQLDRDEGAFRVARSGLVQAELGIQTAAIEMARYRENVKAAEIMLGHATLRSPLSGIVHDRLADPGDMATVGNPILRVFDPARLMLVANVREDFVAKVSVGMKADFFVQALDKTFTGDIREIVPSVDPASRTFLVKVCLGKEPRLVPGMFGRLRIPVGTEQVILIPRKYVSRIGQISLARVRTDSRVTRRLIKVVPHDDKMLRVLSGVREGERLILAGGESR